MNEEELKKGCGKEAGFITFTDDFGNKDEDVMLCGDTTKKINGEIELFLCDTCQARLEGFQKGKLEQKKEDKNKQDEFYNEFDLASNCSKDDKLFKKLWNKYFEQLQKEIGDNSQTEEKVISGKKISTSDKEVAQPYSKSDKPTKEIGSNSK